MKVNELRIGNLINQDNEPVNVYQLDSGGITFCQINNFRINKETGAEQNSHRIMFSGIPLTEEWLAKFGFEKTINKPFIHHVYYKKQKCSIFYNGKDWSISTTSVQYVHQLQNLYFALTGEELEIK